MTKKAVFILEFGRWKVEEMYEFATLSIVLMRRIVRCWMHKLLRGVAEVKELLLDSLADIIDQVWSK